jgi:hypothetical protein
MMRSALYAINSWLTIKFFIEIVCMNLMSQINDLIIYFKLKIIF